MVNSVHDKAVIIVNGYSYIATGSGKYEDIIEFSPWNGKELQNGFMWELQHKIFYIIEKMEWNEIGPDSEFYCDKKSLQKIENLLTDKFNPKSIPEKLRFLLHDRDWFEKQITQHRQQHKMGKFCGGFSAFLDSCYGIEELPIITKIPIKYCPFCGESLPPEFQTDEWWRKRGL